MPFALDSELLRTFLAVAEAGNVTHAAERVGRTQSAVSMQIKRLEAGIGATLFERGPRGVALTRRGDQLVPYARRVVGLLDETGAAMRSQPLEGPVRIGIPEEHSQKILPHALAAFAESHPAVEVTVRSDTSVRQVAALEKDELDLTVVYTPDRQAAGDVLCVDPTIWATSVARRLERRDPVPIALFRESGWSATMAIDSLKRHGVRYRIAYTSDTLAGLVSVASAGLAVASISRSALPPDCRELTAAEGFPQIDFSRVVLRRNPRRSSPAIEAMVRTIRQAFRPAPPAA
jgi:DNA-binding transcriptional LysR family regulator